MLTSVILPVYNRTRYLRGALEGVLFQRGAEMELIVVDDGSEEDVSGALAEFRSQITLLRQPHQGLAAARNTGLRVASGDLVCFLDDDDRFRPGRLAAHAAALREHPEKGFVFSRHAYFSEEMQPEPDPPPEEWLQDPDPARHLLKGNFMAVGAQTIRRELIEAAGPFDESLPGAEDWDMWLRLSRLTSFLFVDQVLIDKRLHSDCLSVNLERCEMGERRVLAKAFREMSVPATERREALRWLNQRIVLSYYNTANTAYRQGAMRKARRYFLRAIQREPRRLLCSHAPWAVLKSLMGAVLLDKARRARSFLFPAAR